MNSKAERLDERLKREGETLNIAINDQYSGACVWIGDLRDFGAGWTARQISAVECLAFIRESLLGEQYDRQVAYQLQSGLNKII